MKTIVLADDESSLRTLVRTTLEGPGFRILEASNGLATLELARRERPDLILLDWMMPQLTGPEVIEALRLDDATRDIPVIMLTARGRVRDRLKAHSLGVAAFLVKPFSPLQLLEKVTEVLQHAAVDHADDPPTLPVASPHVERLMETGDSQLALYVRDLRRVIDSERAKADELVRAHERLRNLDLLKTDFLAFISHELRTPLNAMSVVDMIDVHGESGEQAQIVDLMRTGYARLSALIVRGLEYFHWMAVERVPAQATTDLVVLARAAVEDLRRSGQIGSDLRLSCPHEQCNVRGEAEHLSQVLRVLLNNALKFSRQDRAITVELHAVGRTVRLSVSDRGVGFSPDIACVLFEPFTIADVKHHSEGTGLSLALAQAIVRAYGGTIRAESAGPGQGATFTLEFPVPEPAGVVADAAAVSRTARTLAG